MEKIIAAAVLAGLATIAFAQSNQVDVSSNLYVADLNAAKANKIAVGDQKTSKPTYLESMAKYTYTAKLDDANTLKVFGDLDLYTPFLAGNADPYKSQYAGKVEAGVQYLGFGFDAQTVPAVYFASDNTSSGSKAVTYFTGPTFSTSKAFKDNTNPLSDYTKVVYKYSVDKTLALVGGVEADTALVPVFFVVDVKPQASVIWTFLQADLKDNLTFKTSNADDSSKTYTYTYLEPKITADLKDFVTPGLKVYTTGKFLVATSNGDKLKGSRWDNGATYSFTVKDLGTFAFDTYFRINGIGPDDVSDNQYYDYSLKATYTVKF